MSAPRVTGQDGELSLQVDTRLYSALNIASHGITWNIEIKEVGLIGDKFTRVDTIYKNVSGEIELQIGDREVFVLLQQLIDSAQRRRPPRPIITYKCSITLPATGDRVLLVVPTLVFGSIPLRMPTREDHATVSLAWSAETAGIVFN